MCVCGSAEPRAEGGGHGLGGRVAAAMQQNIIVHGICTPWCIASPSLASSSCIRNVGMGDCRAASRLCQLDGLAATTAFPC